MNQVFFGPNKGRVDPWDIVPSDCLATSIRHRGTPVLYWNDKDQAWYSFNRKLTTQARPLIPNLWTIKPVTSRYILDKMQLVDSKKFQELQKQAFGAKFTQPSMNLVTTISQKNEIWGFPLNNYMVSSSMDIDFQVCVPMQICQDMYAFRPPIPELYFNIRKYRSFKTLDTYVLRDPFS